MDPGNLLRGSGVTQMSDGPNQSRSSGGVEN